MSKPEVVTVYAMLARRHNREGVQARQAGDTCKAVYCFRCAKSWINAARYARAQMNRLEERAVK